MPNWVQNDIYLYGEAKDIKKVLEYVKSDTSEFDFNKIIPMPKTLSLPAGGCDDQSIQYAISKKSEAEQNEIKKTLRDAKCDFCGNYFNKVYDRTFTAEELEACAKEFYDSINTNEKRNIFDDTDYKGLGIKTLEDLGNQYIANIITYGCDTWYDWRCEHWGTKWNASEVCVGDNYIAFQTAWSVPDAILEAFAYICDRYNVTFDGEYADEDRGHNAGHISSENGITEYEADSNEALKAYLELWGDCECIGEDENGNLISYDCDTCPNKCY